MDIEEKLSKIVERIENLEKRVERLEWILIRIGRDCESTPEKLHELRFATEDINPSEKNLRRMISGEDVKKQISRVKVEYPFVKTD